MRDSNTRYVAMKSCKEQAYAEFATELSIVKQIDRIYSDIVGRAHPISTLNFLQLANCGLAIKSYRSLHYAIDALENGYYEVAMTLLRSVFENKLVMMYFAKFPAEAEQWLVRNKKIEQAHIREKLGLQVEKETYGVLSNNYAHPLRLDSLIPVISGSGSTGEGFHPIPYYIPNECRLSVGCWISFANDTIRLLLNVFQQGQLGDGAWA